MPAQPLRWTVMMGMAAFAACASATAAPAATDLSPGYGTPAWEALQVEYGEAIKSRVLAHWIVPGSVVAGSRCQMEIRQVPGGQIVFAGATESCTFDEAGRASLEAAILRAQPLPYRGFEAVFSRDLRLTFAAPED